MDLTFTAPHFNKRPKLGETLRFFGLLSGAEVEIALSRQANEGGRLGTCLLDTGLVDEATLLAALGAQQHVATVDAARLAALPVTVAALLPARAALVARAVPLARMGRRLEVAMLDPGAMRLIDELSAVRRMIIVPRLALEVRLTECLERLYDQTISGRLARTRERIAKRQPQRSDRLPTGETPAFGSIQDGPRHSTHTGVEFSLAPPRVPCDARNVHPPARSARFLPLLVLFLAGSFTGAPAFADWRLLVFSETAGFRHDSIDEGQELLAALGALEGFSTTESEDSAIFSVEGLAPFRAVVFLNTTGDILTASEEAALDCFLRSGGGWVGVHSAADTEHDWPGYGAILGGDAWFLLHPAIQAATLLRESSSHPSTAHFPASFAFTDEWYNFAANPRPAVTVLLTIDEASYLPGPGAMGADHPIAWAHTIGGVGGVGGGRGWYTNLGHRPETYLDDDFAAHLLGGVDWAAGCDAEVCAGDLVFRDGFGAGSLCRWSGGA